MGAELVITNPQFVTANDSLNNKNIKTTLNNYSSAEDLTTTLPGNNHHQNNNTGLCSDNIIENHVNNVNEEVGEWFPSNKIITNKNHNNINDYVKVTTNNHENNSKYCDEISAAVDDDNEHVQINSILKNNNYCNNCSSSNNSGNRNQSMEEEWHQKYAFIIGLLKKPHCVLLKESLSREQDKLSQKLHAYHLERNLLCETINKKLENEGSDTNNNSVNQSLSSQMKHLDLMCVTLERQIDVLGNVEQALPITTENIYSGEPDSLDGTSSEIIMNDDELNTNSRPQNQTGVKQNSNFQITINGRSPLDVLAMLHLERCAHRETRKELNQLRKKYEILRDEFDSGEGMSQSTSLLFSCMNEEMDDEDVFSNNLTNDERCTTGISMRTDEDNGNRLAEEVRLKDLAITQLRSRVLHLEKARIDKVPIDAAKEISRLHSTLLERVRDELTLQNYTLKSKLAELSARISDSTTYRLEKPANNLINNLNNNITINKSNNNDNELDLASTQNGFTHHQNENGTNNNTEEGNSNNAICANNLTMSVTSDDLRLRRKSTYKVGGHNNILDSNTEIKHLRALINDLHTKELEMQHKASQVETELANMKNQLDNEHMIRIDAEKCVLSLEDQLETSQRRMEMIEQCFLAREEECTALKLDVDTLNEENKRLKDDLNILHIKIEKEQSKSFEKFSKFEKEIGSILEQNKVLQEDFNRERVLRKKYYNMVEELKGKIRVFCRIRPLTKSEKNNEIIAKCSDSYTVAIDTPKGQKEFQFDHVFTPEETQEQIFADTKNLIQSAFDGYSVSICGYGQTGSGKTYTILGDELHPGIAPRTFKEIFILANEMSHAYETCVSFYILELYNDKLIDLLVPIANHASSSSSNNNIPPCDSSEPNKLEIRRDRRGTVWISGAKILPAENSTSLEKIFRQALNGRHTATTRMNDKSSRSHLIIGLIIETSSKVNGTVLRGKISLLDLAGSERIGKSGASADTLREANSINKSLSAFGDVINALTTDQSFVPYRNNKLTLLMQDSLGGNAKTLMFVNISPSAYNLEETIVSLTYATRVKQVTNGATRNSETKEVARLKQIIAKLKRGDHISTDDDTL